MDHIFYPLIGGLLIGLASSLMLGAMGRITGISGIIAFSLNPPKRDFWWRYYFLVGLIIGGLLMKALTPDFFHYSFDTNKLKVIAAGLLVGFGTRLGGGCTSGHGVCGLARLSKRSLAATVTFILSGMMTVLMMRILS